MALGPRLLFVGFGLACALLAADASARELKVYSEAEAEQACDRFIPRDIGEAAFGRTEVYRDSMRAIGFACKIFLEGREGAANVALSVDVMLSESPERAYEQVLSTLKSASGPTTKIDGLGDAAFAFAEYDGPHLKGIGIAGAKGAARFQFWTEPEAMSDAFYAQCLAFMKAFVGALQVD